MLYENKVLVYPTTVTSSFQIQAKCKANNWETLILTLNSSDGILIMKQEITANEAREGFVINRNQSSKGICFYTIITEKDELVAKGKLIFP